MSAKNSKTTHGAEICLDACQYFGELIVGALPGNSKEQLLFDNFTPATGSWQRQPLCAKIQEIACGSFKQKNRLK